MFRNALAAIVPASLLMLGCGGGGDSTSVPVIPNGPHVVSTSIYSGTNPAVYTVKPEWSPDGTKISFEGTNTATGAGQGGADVYTVNATPGATPIQVSQWADQHWEYGGKTPAYTSTGELIYWIGWGDDLTIFSLARAAQNQVLNSPTPTIFRSWTASLALNASPEEMTISADGTKVLQSWTKNAYLLDWSSGGDPAVTHFTDLDQVVISREGTHIAYRKSDGNIAWKALSGGTETVLGPGMSPSWATGGRLGYVMSTAGNYKVVTIATGASTTYGGSAYYQDAALSWDAKKIAYRTFGGANSGIAMGQLVEQ